jgi:xylulokinase
MDHSTEEDCRTIAQAAGGALEVCRRTGSVPTARFSGPQIRRFSRIAPESYVATQRIHLVSSFIASVLSGGDAPIDPGDGAGMNLLNLETLQWDEALVAITAPGLSGKLPLPGSPDQKLGQVSAYFVKKYGLSEQAVVVIASGDNPSSLVGMGAATHERVVLSLGTSDTFFAALPTRRTDPQGYGHVFGNPAGGFMALQCFRNGSLARERVKNEHGMDWKTFDEKAFEETVPGNGGNLMLPFFEAEISPPIDLGGPLPTGPDEDFIAGRWPFHAARACVEGQLMNIYLHTRWMQLNPAKLFVTGGAAKSQGIRQVAASLFGVPVHSLATGNSVALGAAIRAASAVFEESIHTLEERFAVPVTEPAIEPEPDTGPIYGQRLEELRELLASHPRHSPF